ncbi:MAG TPA: NUDIX domain-containing protein [Candidatus Sulfotelmatobacter sp.]
MNSTAISKSSISKRSRVRKKTIGVSRTSRDTASRREQVAAACYRIRDSRLEFLLVQTRQGRRWIFPKGGAEPGLTRSESAALEALEEAGVHGRIEEVPFARYALAESGAQDKSEVDVYLCAVDWLSSDHETKRNPTWFAPERAMKRLMQNRERAAGAELCRIIERAVARIERMRAQGIDGPPSPGNYAFRNDPLRTVQFEAGESRRGYVSCGSAPAACSLGKKPAVKETWMPGLPRKVLQLGPAPDSEKNMLRPESDPPNRNR